MRSPSTALLALVALLACAASGAAREVLAAQPSPKPAAGAAAAKPRPAGAQAKPQPKPAAPRNGTKAGGGYYIFGYGSLLNWASTARSNCGLVGLSEDNLAAMARLFPMLGINVTGLINKCTVKRPRAVRVQGLERGWYAPVTNTKRAPGNPFPGSAFNLKWTALGAIAKADAYTTGLVYEVDKKAYDNTIDREEKGGYLVDMIPVSSVTVLSGPPIPSDAKVTAFVSPSDKAAEPSADAPIPLSYIDVFLGGALEMQETLNLTGPAYAKAAKGGYNSFVEETLKTTHGWRPFIVNDREQALRAFGETNYASDIDEALYDFVDHKVLAGMRFHGEPWNSTGGTA